MAGLGAMLIYIWFRFELIYGVAAVIATFHDVIITLGIFSLLGKEITLTVIAALLTLVGYSMNDTIVVFDRIRENVRLNRRQNFKDLVNRSVNQTLKTGQSSPQVSPSWRFCPYICSAARSSTVSPWSWWWASSSGPIPLSRSPVPSCCSGRHELRTKVA